MGRKSYKNGAEIRRSRDEIKDGPLGEIWNNFFKPILEDNKEIFENSDTAPLIIDFIFSQREISQWRVKKDINAVGQEISQRFFVRSDRFDSKIFVRDSRIWVRQDETQTYTDVETDDGRVYRMSNKQFEEIKRYLSREQ